MAVLEKGRRNVQILKQGQYSPMKVQHQVAIIYCGTQGLILDVPTDKVLEFEKEYLEYLDLKHKDTLDKINELVLNIRVGGNDLCHMFGFRRHSDESIHRIRPISNIFSDIITVYGMDYVVSGPVWEYYAGSNWDKGLLQEIQDDKLCGFTGKTVIHPNQISIVNSAYRVSRSDFNDAQSILNWNKNSNSFVSGSLSRERMNEYKTHNNWAQQTLFLAEAYGIQD